MAEADPVSSFRRGDRPRGHRGTSEAEAAIFAATEKLLAEEPLHDLSVAQIIAAAGISRATFYFYFSSKFSVVVGLLGQIMDEIFEGVQPYVSREEAADPAEGLRQSLAGGIDLWSRHRPALRAIHEHWNTTDELRALWLQVIDRFTTAVGAEIDRERKLGLAPKGADSKAIAATLLWSTERCLYVAGLGVDPNLPDEAHTLEPLLAMWIGSIYGSLERPKPAATKARRKRS